jgi:ligand-binding sensor domain-containing protein
MAKWLSNKIFASLILLALLCLNLDIIAQNPLMSVLEVEDVNSDLEIYRIAQDEQGYLWLASNKGLLKYDGNKYSTFPYSDSLSNTKPSAIVVSNTNVYVGFENGHMLTVNRKTKTYVSDIKVSSSEINTLKVNENADVWAGTNGDGLFKIRANEVIQYTTTNALLADNYVHDVVFLAEKIVVATDLGISISNANTIQFETIDASMGLSDNLVLCLLVSNDNNVLAGMQNGSLSKLNMDSRKVENYHSFNTYNQSAIEHLFYYKNEVLALSEANDAYLIDEANQLLQQFDLVNSQESEIHYLDIVLDKEGLVVYCAGKPWLMLANFSVQFIQLHDGQSFQNITSVMCDRDDNLWIANAEGIFRHQNKFSNAQLIEGFYKKKTTDPKIVDLWEDYKGNIWYASFGGGIGVINANTKEIKTINKRQGLLNDNVMSISGIDSTYWMATLGGACKLTFDNGVPHFKNYDETSELGSGYIYTIHCSKQGKVWFGTDGNGLVYLDGETFVFLNQKFPESGKSVIAMAEDNMGRIWFYSSDHGLQWTDVKGVYNFDTSSLASNLEIYAMQKGGGNQIVLLTSAGIALIDTDNKTLFVDYRKFGLEANYLNVIAQDKLGQVWAGTTDELIRLSQDLNLGKSTPRVYLESVDILLEPIDTTLHEFKFDQNHFTFHFTSIWLQEPSSVKYQYQLVGFDKDWVTTNEAKVIFAQLQPGKYTFMLRAVQQHNEWDNAPIVTYSFEIIKPYWQQVWFYLLLAAAVFFIIWGVLKIRLNSIRKREAIARERIQSQFDTLRNQVNPHFLFNSFNTLISIISTDKDGAIDYVEKLSDYFRIVLEQRDKEVITFKEELELVRNYLFLQKKRFGENLNVVIDLEEQVYLSFVPPLTIQLLVENAIKHNVISRSKPLNIYITLENEYVVVSNNIQEKLTKEASTGIGLDNIQSRYSILFNKHIVIIKSENTFSVKLPVIFVEKNE